MTFQQKNYTVVCPSKQELYVCSQIRSCRPTTTRMEAAHPTTVWALGRTPPSVSFIVPAAGRRSPAPPNPIGTMRRGGYSGRGGFGAGHSSSSSDGRGYHGGNPCLTMHQPWASLLVHGIKRVEGRSWPSPIAGPSHLSPWDPYGSIWIWI